MKKIIILFSMTAVLFACKNEKQQRQEEVQQYLETYNLKYRELYYASSQGQWLLNTRIIEGDTMNAYKSRMADEAMVKFTGSKENIDKATAFLKWESDLDNLQVKQLKKILYLAAGGPESAGDAVKELIKAGTKQTETLYGFKFTIDNKEVTPNQIDSILASSNDVAMRKKTWEASKEVGKALKPGLENLQQLRNQVVQSLGYSDYFEYQVSDYGISTGEMMTLLKKFNQEVYPMFRELHTYARYELAKKYGVKEVPDYLPAHWLTNRWGQQWDDMIEVEGFNLDSSIKANKKDAEWLAKQSEKFYMSIGFNALPATFWEKSSLYPVAADAGYKKNTHASAWHLNLENDLRSLMSIEPNAEWYETVHHEYGHIYYFESYSNPDVPYLLREGANRAYHEAIGSLLGLAAMQQPFVAGLGLADTTMNIDMTKQLLKDALHYIVFIPWSAGTMSTFEKELYADNLSPDQYNKRWWEIVRQYQGIVPSSERGEEYCDAASKTHINDDAAQYYDYALSYILLFQLHDYISKNILKQDPHTTNYYGNKEVGDFLKSIMKPGASGDWRALLKEKTGEDLSARAMLDYFMPLMAWLKEQNKGRNYTLPETL